MSKDKNIQKKGNNKPSKTLKEKKQARREKKAKKNEKANPDVFSS